MTEVLLTKIIWYNGIVSALFVGFVCLLHFSNVKGTIHIILLAQ